MMVIGTDIIKLGFSIRAFPTHGFVYFLYLVEFSISVNIFAYFRAIYILQMRILLYYLIIFGLIFA